MIFGEFAFILNFFAVATVAFFFGITLINLSQFLPQFRSESLSQLSWSSYSANARRSILWFTVFMPWILAFGCLIFLFISLSTDVIWVSRLLHWHHANAFNLLSWHAYPSLIFFAMLLIVLYKTYRNAKEHIKAYSLLRLITNKDQLLESDKPQAFSAGFFVPLVFISTGLINELNENELQIVKLHEQAHVERNDSLKKLIFSFLSSFYPFSIARTLRQGMSLCMEQCADESIVRNSKNKLDVAKVLLKVTKLIRAYSEAEKESLNCAFAENELTGRIQYLISPQEKRSISPTLISILLATVFFVCLLSVDTFHHAVEIFFNH